MSESQPRNSLGQFGPSMAGKNPPKSISSPYELKALRFAREEFERTRFDPVYAHYQRYVALRRRRDILDKHQPGLPEGGTWYLSEEGEWINYVYLKPGEPKQWFVKVWLVRPESGPYILSSVENGQETVLVHDLGDEESQYIMEADDK